MCVWHDEGYAQEHDASVINPVCITNLGAKLGYNGATKEKSGRVEEEQKGVGYWSGEPGVRVGVDVVSGNIRPILRGQGE